MTILGKKKSITLAVLAVLAIALVIAVAVATVPATTESAHALSGSGTAADPYLIGTKTDLETFRDIVNGTNGQTRNLKACAELTENINLNGSANNTWVPICVDSYYQGTFDGKGYTISGLYISKDTGFAGLFSRIQNATICNVTVKGTLSDRRMIGGIAAYSSGGSTIFNCTNECAISSSYSDTMSYERNEPVANVGGIIGYVYGNGNSIKNCTNKGTITGVTGNVEGAFGGIVGNSQNSMTIRSCSNVADIIAGRYVGGILGFSKNNTTVRNCVNSGNVTGWQAVGGIQGRSYLSPAIIIGCYNNGVVTSQMPKSDSGSCYAGGIIGQAYSGDNISYCGNNGNVVASRSEVGGISGSVGRGATISKCYNTGNVSGYAQNGGIVGSASSNSTITNCYNVGNIRANDAKTDVSAGIAGSADGATISYVFNCGSVTNLNGVDDYPYTRRGSISGAISGGAIHHTYYLEGSYRIGIGYFVYTTNVSTYWWYNGQKVDFNPEVCTATKLTAAQMQEQSSFVDWDFDSVWIMGENYPVLRHAHDFTCAAEGNTITATCDRPYCEVENGIVYSITLYAPTMARERDGGVAAATLDADQLAAFNAGTGLGVSNNNITYARKNGNEVTSLGTTAPTVFGDYIATLTVGTASVSYDYTIEKLELEFDQDVLLNNEPSPTTVSNLNGETAATLLDEEEINRYINGESVNIYLEVNNESPTVVIPKADKTAAKTLLGENNKEGAYLDLSLFKQLSNDESRTAIHESATVFQITVDIPSNLAQPFGCTRTYSIVRVHNGVAETLESEVNDGRITFETDQFSTYLIAYNDTYVEDADETFIVFTTNVTGETTRYIDTDNHVVLGDNNDTVTVTYKITNNPGFNSMLLVPQYNTNVFSIAHNSDIVISDALGDAKITAETEPRTLPLKIEIGNTGDKYSALDGENEFFLTITYTITAPLDGEYEFGLVLGSSEENGASVAYYILDGEERGLQNQVGIKVVAETVLTLIEMEHPVIEIGYTQPVFGNYEEEAYEFIYSGEAIAYEEHELDFTENHTVYYTYNGDGEITITWYYDNNGVPGAALNAAPTTIGNYFIGIQASATQNYYAAAEVYRLVVILPMQITVTIDDKNSAYGADIVPLTYQVTSGSVAQGDNAAFDDAINALLTTNATNASPVGVYSIYANTNDDPYVYGSYTILFEEGTYSIDPLAITITALDQSAEYTGDEPEASQTAYTVTVGQTTYQYGEYDVGGTVVIAKEAGANVGSYALTPSLTNNNFTITTVPGVFTITSVGKNADYIMTFFTGATKNYTKTEYDLLIVDANVPAWIANNYTVSNGANIQTNAGSYPMTVVVTLDLQTTKNYIDADAVEGATFYIDKHYDATNETYTDLIGTINQAEITITADEKSSVYGETPKALTSTVTGTIYNNDELGITLTCEVTASSNVGEYEITVTASNANYNITLHNGAYNVTKAPVLDEDEDNIPDDADPEAETPANGVKITLSADSTYYNRPLSNSYLVMVGSLTLEEGFTVTIKDSNEVTYAPNEVLPAGTYTITIDVDETDNYYAATKSATFTVRKVKLEDVTFTYGHGNVTWTEVANDTGKTNDEEGVTAKGLKEGTTITYYVYDGEELVGTYNNRSFDAAKATTYIVKAVASDDNYIASETTMVAAHEVTFAEGDHAENPDGEVSNLPDPQYIFDGATVVKPTDNPEVDGCQFSAWKLAGATYLFTEAVNGDITLVAVWDEVLYTITLKYLDSSETENEDVFTLQLLFGDVVDYSSLNLAPTKPSDETGTYYTFANKWTDENGVVYTAKDDIIRGFTVPANAVTFFAVYELNYEVYTITYYVSESTSTATAAYTQVGETQEAHYKSVITYRELPASDVAWFRIDGWYSNEARTANADYEMPAHDISVYAGYTFDIGTGDVNGDGEVEAKDITTYRQWVVGGYDVIEVAVGNEWTTVTDESFDASKVYFIKRVADNNNDESYDIRDVSIIRMAIVNGYAWDIVADVVTGQSIVRSAPILTVNSIASGINTYGRARLLDDVTEATKNLTINTTKNVYVDLNGKTLTLKSLTINTTGVNATIRIVNGTIVAENGITVTAPNGNVVIENVTAYVDGSPINLQAASHSLHFFGEVEFYNADIVNGELQMTEATQEQEAQIIREPAPIHVEEGTHVVVEKQATLTVEKLVATENFAVSETASIAVDNKTETPVVVEGNSVNQISDLTSFQVAAAAGGEYTLVADIEYNGTLSVSEDMILNLNNHTIRSRNNVALAAVAGATLTINGNGNVYAQEACVMAFDGSSFEINGGTYTSYDNFVFGTNGSTGRGNNTITINGGTFNGGIQSAGYVACGIYVANSDTVVVNGGTFNVTNGVGILARSGNTTVKSAVTFHVTGNGSIGKVGDSKVTVPSGEVLVLDLAAGYPGGQPSITNNSDYTVYRVVAATTASELTAAIADTTADMVVVKKYDITLTEAITINRDVTISILDGKKITGPTNNYAIIVTKGNVVLNGTNGSIVSVGRVLYVGDQAEVTIKGGTYTSSSECALAVRGGMLTIENGTFNAQEMCVIVTHAGELVVNGGTFNAYDNAVLGTNGSTGIGNNTITVNGGTFNGYIQSTGYVACGIYVANSDTVVVNGGTFNVTNGCGILARSGNTTVNEGVTFNVTGDPENKGKVGDSRVVVPCGTELVEDHVAGYPGGQPTLNNIGEYNMVVINP